MKYKNGFTLTELLATIVILAVISLIATPAVIGVSNSIKNNMFESKKKLILQAAKLYAEDNPNKNSLNVNVLCYNNYLTRDSKKRCAKNPKNNEFMDNCKMLIIRSDSNDSIKVEWTGKWNLEGSMHSSCN